MNKEVRDEGNVYLKTVMMSSAFVVNSAGDVAKLCPSGCFNTIINL